jgi:hypothetical protein
MMTGLGRSGLLAAVVAGVSAFSGVANAQTASATLVKEAAEDNARITVPATGCVLANNVWDRQVTPTGFSQSVFLEKRGDETLPGWRWNAPGERSAVLSMPEVICGDKPWDTPLRLRSEFPFRAGEKRLHANFDIDLKAEGRYNMAFSLWAVSKLPAVKQNIIREIMIWNVDSGMTPLGEKIGTLETKGTTFDIYLEKNQGMVTGPDPFTWTLVSFVARTPLLKGSLDFGVFVDELLKRKILARNEYLTSLELGDEVAEGSGEVVVKKFDVGTILQID